MDASSTGTALATAITNIGTVVTGFGVWIADVAKMVLEEPVLLVPFGITIAFAAIGGFKRLGN